FYGMDKCSNLLTSNFSREVFLQDAGQEIVEIFNLERSDKQPQVILIEIDALQPINQALAVLADNHSTHYLDRHGRSVDPLRLLSCWQQRFSILAKNIDSSRLLIVQSHAASSQLTGKEQEDFGSSRCDWIDGLAHEYSISAEAFITLAASV